MTDELLADAAKIMDSVRHLHRPSGANEFTCQCVFCQKINVWLEHYNQLQAASEIVRLNEDMKLYG